MLIYIWSEYTNMSIKFVNERVSTYLFNFNLFLKGNFIVPVYAKLWKSFLWWPKLSPTVYLFTEGSADLISVICPLISLP
jgi:hypothetical protein